jgi:RNA polymerase-binding transcription factor DksA
LRAAIEETQDARSLTFTDDEHDPEGSTASLDQARDTALLAQVTRTLAELEAARARLESGLYGVCERCGQPIAPARLAARPEARTCVRCASRSLRP